MESRQNLAEEQTKKRTPTAETSEVEEAARKKSVEDASVSVLIENLLHFN